MYLHTSSLCHEACRDEPYLSPAMMRCMFTIISITINISIILSSSVHHHHNHWHHGIIHLIMMTMHEFTDAVNHLHPPHHTTVHDDVKPSWLCNQAHVSCPSNRPSSANPNMARDMRPDVASMLAAGVPIPKDESYIELHTCVVSDPVA